MCGKKKKSRGHLMLSRPTGVFKDGSFWKTDIESKFQKKIWKMGYSFTRGFLWLDRLPSVGLGRYDPRRVHQLKDVLEFPGHGRGLLQTGNGAILPPLTFSFQRKFGGSKPGECKDGLSPCCSNSQGEFLWPDSGFVDVAVK